MNRRAFMKNIAFVAGGAVLGGSISQAAVKLSNNSMNVGFGKQRPNVVFIMADDLGYNHLGCYGQEKIKTPNIDKLASQGVRFTQAYAGCTVCGPSRSALLTGLHTGHIPYRRNDGFVPIVDANKTTAELFKEAGYATGCFGKWGLGDAGSGQEPTQRGFDTFWGLLSQGHGHIHYPSYIWHNEEKHPLPNVTRSYSYDWGRSSLNFDERVKHTDTMFEEKALEFIQQNHEKPFFCYLPFDIPHTEMVARESSTAAYRDLNWPEYYSGDNGAHLPTSTPRANFAGMITQLDETVGKVTKLLESLKIADNTIIIFTSDNGGQLKETWGNAPSIFFEANGVLRKGKTWNYEGGIRVPMVVRWPNVIKPATISDHACYFPDFMPTFADLLGLDAPDDIDGVSMLPTLLGNSAEQEQHEFMYWEHPVYSGSMPTTQLRQAVRMGKWKGLRERTTDSTIELYDLDNDLSETSNVASSNPGIVSQIVAIMNQEHVPPLPQ